MSEHIKSRIEPECKPDNFDPARVAGQEISSWVHLLNHNPLAAAKSSARKLEEQFSLNPPTSHMLALRRTIAVTSSDPSERHRNHLAYHRDLARESGLNYDHFVAYTHELALADMVRQSQETVVHLNLLYAHMYDLNPFDSSLIQAMQLRANAATTFMQKDVYTNLPDHFEDWYIDSYSQLTESYGLLQQAIQGKKG